MTSEPLQEQFFEDRPATKRRKKTKAQNAQKTPHKNVWMTPSNAAMSPKARRSIPGS